jgi:hypothetical protein
MCHNMHRVRFVTGFLNSYLTFVGERASGVCEYSGQSAEGESGACGSCH